MKRYLLVIVLLASVIFASGCTQTQTNQNNQSTLSYSVNGISFNYPADWLVVSQNLQNNSVVSLRDPELQRSNGTRGDLVQIVRQATRANLTYQGVKNQLLNGTNQNATDGTVTIAGITANSTSFAVTSNGTETNLKLLYFEKNNLTYILTFITIGVNNQEQQQFFNTIINSFKIQ